MQNEELTHLTIDRRWLYDKRISHLYESIEHGCPYDLFFDQVAGCLLFTIELAARAEDNEDGTIDLFDFRTWKAIEWNRFDKEEKEEKKKKEDIKTESKTE